MAPLIDKKTSYSSSYFLFVNLDILSYEGGFVVINRPYKPAYDDTNSAEYLRFAEEVAAAVSVVFTINSSSIYWYDTEFNVYYENNILNILMSRTFRTS